jgi:hypothetical protein
MVGRYGRRGETARATDGMTIRLLTILELPRRHHLSWHLIMGLVRSWAAVVGPVDAREAVSDAADHE